ncbi:MAG: 50S ribosomal protein L29 [Candidatus Omnitrophica bacterium]|nr:50S ribosomal protein L29 [Candidatus Omnitrophota bacterium]
MKMKELIALGNEELIAKEKSMREELSKLSMQRYQGRVEKPHMFSLLKRDLARIQTIRNQKGL